MLARSRPGKVDAQEEGNFMSDGQLADYLADLRTSRVARLKGSRPAPPSKYSSQRRADSGNIPREPPTNLAGRPLVPQPLRPSPSSLGKEIDGSKVSGNLSTSPSVIYLEDGTRQTERQEAHSLRVALEDLDSEEERRIYEAAQAEASQLVLEHTSPTKKTSELGFTNPDLRPQDRRVHLRQGNQVDLCLPKDQDQFAQDIANMSLSPASQSEESGVSTKASAQGAEPPELQVANDHAATVSRKKGYQGLANAVAVDIANIKSRVSSGGRRIVSGSKRKVSSEKHPFPNREDKIYEEPEVIKEEEPSNQELPVNSIHQPVNAVEAPSDPEMPRHLRKNPFARVRFNKDNLERANSVASVQTKKFDPVEIQRNPPTQSRRPWYMSNKLTSTPAIPIPGPTDSSMEDEPDLKTKDGLEVRGDDIRAATSMKRKDRNPNLPQPTAVSASPGRPIVSFQSDWQKDEAKRNESKVPPRATTSSAPPVLHSKADEPRFRAPIQDPSAVAAPVQHLNARPRDAVEHRHRHDRDMALSSVNIPNGIPILNLPDDDDGTASKVLSEEPDIPQINILQCDSDARPKSAPAAPSRPFPQFTPSIEMEDCNAKQPAARPLPMPNKNQSHRLSNHMHSLHGSMSKPHLTSHQKRNAVLCAHCALPIAGRILTAAGERFHPECFTCHRCGINLECVAFYPEPDQKYYERIARIQQRMQGMEIAVPEGVTEEDIRRLEQQDGDESMRFFCHLDFHEMYSPRCRSCKTPIEGEVVVACGAEWHVGHFFCAQCGDPFDSTTPFVEKDGYAWCLGCHTNRYSPKCRKCRKPVTDIVVNALGHDWHAGCFCCSECGSGFDDGQYFLRGNSADPVCIRCEDRRLKA